MRLRLFLAVAAGLGAAVVCAGSLPAAASADVVAVPYTQFTLQNGLNVIVHEDHSVPVVTVNVWYNVGSAREKQGRTGFAHLFEHLMFEGSGHVREGELDRLLEATGGTNNGSTTEDRTNYWTNVPSNALELALFLESDRMGYLLDSMTPQRVDGQRDVVKNERRQSYENRPYGMADLELNAMLYPEGHPYHWPVIGYMDDLTAATYEDVVEFFKKYYAPGNASLAIAGDIDTAEAQKLAEKWFGDVKAGQFVEPIAPPAAVIAETKRKTLQDRVQLPRLYLAWLTPQYLSPGDAELDVVAGVLAGGKNSRLYKRLVYDMQIAQDVSAYQQSGALGSQFSITVTARPPRGDSDGQDAVIDEIRRVIDEELDRLRETPPTDREHERTLNQVEASFYNRMERVGGFGGKADQLNQYYFATGNPDYFSKDLARYRALAPSDVRAAVRFHLPRDRRVELVVQPGKN